MFEMIIIMITIMIIIMMIIIISEDPSGSPAALQVEEYAYPREYRILGATSRL